MPAAKPERLMRHTKVARHLERREADIYAVEISNQVKAKKERNDTPRDASYRPAWEIIAGRCGNTLRHVGWQHIIRPRSPRQRSTINRARDAGEAFGNSSSS